MLSAQPHESYVYISVAPTLTVGGERGSVWGHIMKVKSAAHPSPTSLSSHHQHTHTVFNLTKQVPYKSKESTMELCRFLTLIFCFSCLLNKIDFSHQLFLWVSFHFYFFSSFIFFFFHVLPAIFFWRAPLEFPACCLNLFKCHSQPVRAQTKLLHCMSDTTYTHTHTTHTVRLITVHGPQAIHLTLGFAQNLCTQN